MVLIIAQHDTPQTHSSWWFLFVCLNDLVELHTHRYCARNKTKRTQTIIWIWFFFLPRLRVILSDFDRSSPFGTSIERKKKETQVIRHCGLIRLTRRPNRQVKIKKRKIIKTFLCHQISHRHVRQKEEDERNPARRPPNVLFRCETSVRSRAQPWYGWWEMVTKSTSPHHLHHYGFSCNKKMISLATRITARRLFRYESNNWEKKNNYNVNKSNNNNESNWK